jgi:SPP1 family phage portal protein
MLITPMDHIKALLASSRMTELEFFAAQIAAWKGSPERLLQIKGVRYYENDQDILRRKRQMIDNRGTLTEVANRPNNRVVDNQYALLVDQKTGYLLSRPFSLSGENEAYKKALGSLFNREFRRKLLYLGTSALNGGIAWLFPYYDETELRFAQFPAYEILPFWADDGHERLDCALRLYEQEVYDGNAKKTVEKVELYKPDGIHRYVYDCGKLTPDDEPHAPYFMVKQGKEEKGYNWERIPLIPFRYNKGEIPLLKRVKCLQDALNLMHSDFLNVMQEQSGSSTLVLHNYDGTDLAQFRTNLALFNAVKVRDTEAGKGDVTTLELEVNPENYKVILDLLKRAIIENGRGYNAKDDKAGSDPNQLNIKSMYSDIDIDTNNMEVEFQAAFEALLWFINQYLASTGQGSFSEEDVEITFSRDVLMNESQAIQDCKASVGMLSDETIIDQHPWVKDTQKELKRVEKQKQEAVDSFGANYLPGHDAPAQGADREE